MARKQRGTNVEEESWRTLKVFCAQQGLCVGDKAGDIICAWVAENCENSLMASLIS